MKRRIQGAVSVLLGLSEESATAWRHPVYTSIYAWRCSRCGHGFETGGAGANYGAVHRCGDGLTGFTQRGALQYKGLRSHAALVWSAIKSGMPTRVQEDK